MASRERLICESARLVEAGDGVRFDVGRGDATAPAFAVRHAGKVRAYLNRCAHVPIELDWQPGRFFDSSGLYVICAMHGAHYEPETGRCVMGPCKGRALVPVPVIERDGAIYLVEGGDERRTT